MFTYKRPNEISSTAGESFLAEGPTNEILDVYVRMLNFINEEAAQAASSFIDKQF